jgi:hypothetical protein
VCVCAIVQISVRHTGVNKGHNSLSLQNATIPKHLLIMNTMNIIRGQDSVVGIATRYGLDGPGIEYR